MPFVYPVESSKNQARWKTAAACDDFLLQEHRYSLRRSRHEFCWVRVITRATRPRLKVAQGRSIEELRGREWKYISEDLAASLPEPLRCLPPSNMDRSNWLIIRLIDVGRRLGDIVEGDEDDDDVDFEEYFDDCSEDDECEDHADRDEDVREFKDSENDLFATPTVEVPSDHGDDDLEGLSSSRPGEPSCPSAMPRDQSCSPRDLSPRDGSPREGSSLQGMLSREPSPRDASPDLRNGGRRRFKISRAFRGNRGLRVSDSSENFTMSGLHLPPPASTVPTVDHATTGPGLRRRKTSDSTRSIAATPRGRAPAEHAGTNNDEDPSMLVARSSTVSSTASAGSAPAATGAGRNSKLLSSSWMRTSLQSIGLRSKPASEPGGNGAGDLPAYLTSGSDGLKGKGKRQAVTMEALKQAHERRSMAKGVIAATSISLVLRYVSFDAFLLLLVALNIAVCYGVHHRHMLVKRFAKSSIKRRVKFTRQVWNSRWSKKSGENGSKPGSAGVGGAAVQGKNSTSTIVTTDGGPNGGGAATATTSVSALEPPKLQRSVTQPLFSGTTATPPMAYESPQLMAVRSADASSFGLGSPLGSPNKLSRHASASRILRRIGSGSSTTSLDGS